MATEKHEARDSVASHNLFCLQAKDAFNDWETVYKFPTRDQAKKMKAIREAEPVYLVPCSLENR